MKYLVAFIASMPSPDLPRHLQMPADGVVKSCFVRLRPIRLGVGSQAAIRRWEN